MWMSPNPPIFIQQEPSIVNWQHFQDAKDSRCPLAKEHILLQSTLPFTLQLLLYFNHFKVAKLFTVQKIHFHCLELATENDLQK